MPINNTQTATVLSPLAEESEIQSSLLVLTKSTKTQQKQKLFLCFPLFGERERKRALLCSYKRAMLCLGRVLSLSYPINCRLYPCNFHNTSYRFNDVRPRLSSKWRSMASDPESSSFASSIESDPADRNAAGYSL